MKKGLRILSCLEQQKGAHRERSRLKRYRLLARRMGIPADEADEIDRKACLNPHLEVLTSVFAPAVYGFAKWILEMAEQRGIRKLYFLSRDGFSVFETVRSLISERGEGPEVHMLYVSRYTLRIPFYEESPCEAVRSICGGETILTWRRIFLRAGLDEKTIDEMLKAFAVEQPDAPLSKREIKRIRKLLPQNAGFVEAMCAASRKSRRRTETYLTGAGFFTREKIGIVDSGWSGNTQLLLRKMRKKRNITEALEGFYFGLNRVPEELEKESVHPFFFGPSDRFRKSFFRCSVFEAVLCPPTGTVLGYEGENGIPVLSESQDSGRREQITQTVLAETSRLAKADAVLQLSVDTLCTYTRAGLRRFMQNPTDAEAGYFGSLLFSGEMTDAFPEELAPALAGKVLNQRLFLPSVLRSLSLARPLELVVPWPEGTLRRSAGGVCIFRKADLVCTGVARVIYEEMAEIFQKICGRKEGDAVPLKRPFPAARKSPAKRPLGAGDFLTEVLKKDILK